VRRKNGIPLATVMKKLDRLYDPPETFLHFRTPLDLLVAVILSAQCTDAMVNKITETTLFPKYRKAEDYVKVPREELERDIRRSGSYRSKAKYVQETCAMLLDLHGGEVPRTMEELTALRGVGRKTASVVLSAAFGINAGIAVDTHVQRLSQRLGLSTEHDPKKIELDLMAAAPRERWRDVTVLLISHGRAVCTALHRKCGACVFKDDCPSSLTRGKPDLAKPKKAKARLTA
jgi:endonuclease-3